MTRLESSRPPRERTPERGKYRKPITVTISERDAKYLEGVEPGRYEIHPHGTIRQPAVYVRASRRVTTPGKKGSLVAPGQLRRVKHRPTIAAVLDRVNSERGR